MESFVPLDLIDLRASSADPLFFPPSSLFGILGHNRSLISARLLCILSYCHSASRCMVFSPSWSASLSLVIVDVYDSSISSYSTPMFIPTWVDSAVFFLLFLFRYTFYICLPLVCFCLFGVPKISSFIPTGKRLVDLEFIRSFFTVFSFPCWVE